MENNQEEKPNTGDEGSAKGRFIIDDTIDQKTREDIIDDVKEILTKMKDELAERTPIINKRQDFFEGRHHKWTNVVGQVVKQQEGHILAVFNVVNRMCVKIHQTLTNNPPRIKIVPQDEANEIEVSRAQGVEQAIGKILNDNKFWKTTFKRSAINQIRDGDFIVECKVMADNGVNRIEIKPNEDLLKISVGWDDASGTSFSFVSFEDMWSTSKILREYGYEAEGVDQKNSVNTDAGSHLKDQYGMFASAGGAAVSVPSGQANVPKARVRDYWGYQVLNGEIKVVNLIFINDDCVQFISTDYKKTS